MMVNILHAVRGWIPWDGRVAPSRYDSTMTAIHPIDDMPQTFAYNVDGTINHIEATDGTDTWRQTMTWTDSKLTGISGWVKQ